MATSAQVKVTVVGDSSSLEKALDSAASKTDSVGGKMKAAFHNALSTINNTGVLGPFGAALDGVGNSLDALGEKQKGLGQKMQATGAIGVGVGAGLVAAAKGDEDAHAQLAQAIDNTGASYSDYSDQIDKVIGQQEHYGHTAKDTQQALGNLTTSQGDAGKAMDLMGVTADLAAKRHMSLADASDLVTKVLEGKGGKALSNFGITMDKSIKDPTARGQKALDELSQKLQGDAAASADTFGGKLDSIKAKVEDSAASLGQKYGPALMGVSAALGIAGTAMEALSGFELAEAIASLAAFWWVAVIVAALALVGVAIYELYTHWDTVWAAIKSVVDGAWQFIQTVFHFIVDNGLKFIQWQINELQAGWNTVWGAIKGTVSSAWDFLSGVFHFIVDNGIGLIKSEIQGLQWIWNTVWNAVSGAVSDAWNFISGIFDKIKGGVSDVVNGIKSIPGVSTVMSLFNASGASYSPGGMTLVGEHGPEMVMMPQGASVTPAPATAAALAGSGGGGGDGGNSIYLTVHAGMGTDGAQVGQQIVSALARFQQSGGRIPATLIG